MSEKRHDLLTGPQPKMVEPGREDNGTPSDSSAAGTENGAGRETRVLSPQDFYEEMTAREDVREILARLARQ